MRRKHKLRWVPERIVQDKRPEDSIPNLAPRPGWASLWTVVDYCAFILTKPHIWNEIALRS